MVRLKGHAPDVIPGFHAFQFHYGTIKSRLIDSSTGCIVYFNSTMVRLKVHERIITGFFTAYFNSTMVRLKETAEQKLEKETRFQFHYGTIKSKETPKSLASGRNISIPLWYD